MGHAIIQYHSLTFLFQINACDPQVRLSTVSENVAIVLMVNFWNTRVWFYFTHSFLFTRWCINWPLLSLRLLSALTFKFEMGICMNCLGMLVSLATNFFHASLLVWSLASLIFCQNMDSCFVTLIFCWRIISLASMNSHCILFQFLLWVSSLHHFAENSHYFIIHHLFGKQSHQHTGLSLAALVLPTI